MTNHRCYRGCKSAFGGENQVPVASCVVGHIGIRFRAVVLGLSVASAVGLATGINAAAPEDASPFNPRSVIARTFANLYEFNSVQRIEVRAGWPDGEHYVRTVQVIRRVGDGLNRMLVRFVNPPDLRGVALLLRERADFSYDSFLYQPILMRTRRVTVAQRSNPFFGTDVYFEDLEAKRSSQWKPKLLREEEVKGRSTWVIALEPDGFPSSYERIVGWFDRELPVMLRAQFYRAGKRVKTLEVDYERIVEIDGFLVPTRMVFRGDPGTVTTLEISETDIRSEIPAERFSPFALEFGDQRSDAAP